MKVIFLSAKNYSNPSNNNGDCILIDTGTELFIYDCGCEEHAKKVIEYINNGRLNGYGQYPQLIRQRVFDESEGKIKLDISGLNLRNSVQKNKNRK